MFSAKKAASTPNVRQMLMRAGAGGAKPKSRFAAFKSSRHVGKVDAEPLPTVGLDDDVRSPAGGAELGDDQIEVIASDALAARNGLSPKFPAGAHDVLMGASPRVEVMERMLTTVTEAGSGSSDDDAPSKDPPAPIPAATATRPRTADVLLRPRTADSSPERPGTGNRVKLQPLAMEVSTAPAASFTSVTAAPDGGQSDRKSSARSSARGTVTDDGTFIPPPQPVPAAAPMKAVDFTATDSAAPRSTPRSPGVIGRDEFGLPLFSKSSKLLSLPSGTLAPSLSDPASGQPSTLSRRALQAAVPPVVVSV